jgi:hypothetical protein
MEKMENERRFPLFHSKSRYYDDCLWAFFHLAGADLPTTKPEAPRFLPGSAAIHTDARLSRSCLRSEEPATQCRMPSLRRTLTAVMQMMTRSNFNDRRCRYS